MQRSRDSPDNKKNHREEMRMIKKSSLSSYVDVIISNKLRYQYECPYEEILKVIDGRDMLDVMEDKFSY